MIDFGKTIRKVLVDKDMQQQQLADILFMSKQQFNQILNKPDFRINSDIARIADALGYDVRLTLVDRATGKRIDCD